MLRARIFITGVTYPMPGRSFDELVSLIGIQEDGTWIRIYPVPLSFLISPKGKVKNVKYSWIEIDLIQSEDDIRQESYTPVNYDFGDAEVGESIGVEGNWSKRKNICLKKVYTNKKKLLKATKDPQNVSIVVFKPTQMIGFEIERSSEGWTDEWTNYKTLNESFETEKLIETIIPKLPNRFFYRFADDAGIESKLMIEDWELATLYWSSLKKSGGSEKAALNKVREQYEENFIENKEIYFFLGTTKELHHTRSYNPFIINGIFHPNIELQKKLF